METTSSVLPRGYVFAPTDSELLGHFLFSKIQNPTVQFEEIHDPNSIYEYVPDILTSLHEKKGRAKEWYFFSRVTKKHGNGSRLSRSVAGQKELFWRASTGEKKIRGYNGQLLGKRTTLNYYEGKDSKTDWIMKEYILLPPQDHLHHPLNNKFEDQALCKIYKNNRNKDATTSTSTTTKTSTVLVDHQLEDNNARAQECMECMVPAQLPYCSFGDDNGAQEALVRNIEQDMMTPMIINQDHQPSVPFMATYSTGATMVDANMEPNDPEYYDDVEKLLLDIDYDDVDPEEFAALIEASYNGLDDPTTNNIIGAEKVETTTEVMTSGRDHEDQMQPPPLVEVSEEGDDWLHGFPQFEPADLEFNHRLRSMAV